MISNNLILFASPFWSLKCWPHLACVQTSPSLFSLCRLPVVSSPCCLPVVSAPRGSVLHALLLYCLSHFHTYNLTPWSEIITFSSLLWKNQIWSAQLSSGYSVTQRISENKYSERKHFISPIVAYLMVRKIILCPKFLCSKQRLEIISFLGT